MIDKTITDPANQQIKLKIEQRKEQLERDYTLKCGELSRRGILRSGASLVEQSNLAKAYVLDVAQIAWETLHRFITTAGVNYDDGLADELKSIIEGYLPDNPDRIPVIRIQTVIGPKDEKLFQIYADTISEGNQQAVDYAHSEIDLFILTLKRESEGHTHASQRYSITNIHGPVGAVQYGDHSTAQVTQNIDTEAATAAKKALDLIEQLFSQSQPGEVPEDVRVETLELVSEGKQELAKADPDRSKVKVILIGLNRTVQTLAALEGARQLVSSALGFF